MSIEMIALLALPYSNAVPSKVYQYLPPSQTQTIETGLPDDILEKRLLTAHALSLRERRQIINDLEKAAQNTLKLPYYFPLDRNDCYQFIVKGDGTIVAVFVYRTQVNKLDMGEEPTQLHQIIHIKENEKANIIEYKPAISTKAEFWEKFWRNTHNILGVKLDEDGKIEAEMKKMLDRYLEQSRKNLKPKPKKPKKVNRPLKAQIPYQLIRGYHQKY